MLVAIGASVSFDSLSGKEVMKGLLGMTIFFFHVESCVSFVLFFISACAADE